MTLEHRLLKLEFKIKVNSKQAGCDISLFIVLTEEQRESSFDTDTHRPSNNEIEKQLKQLKDSGRCQDCRGSCAIDWAPDGFKNHTLMGESCSSASAPKIFAMFCANSEIPGLTRRIMNGERTRSNDNFRSLN
jgi:hypothetical protein